MILQEFNEIGVHEIEMGVLTLCSSCCSMSYAGFNMIACVRVSFWLLYSLNLS